MSGIGDQLVIQYGPAILQMLVEGLLLPLLAVAFAWIGNKFKNEKMKEFISHAEDTARKCVIAANQEIVDGLKGTDGWTEEAQKAVFDKVVANVMTILAEDGLAALNKYTGDGLLWINNTVLEYVRIYKKG